MNKEDLVRTFDEYLNENSLWLDFSAWVEDRMDCTTQELGFNE